MCFILINGLFEVDVLTILRICGLKSADGVVKLMAKVDVVIARCFVLKCLPTWSLFG